MAGLLYLVFVNEVDFSWIIQLENVTFEFQEGYSRNSYRKLLKLTKSFVENNNYSKQIITLLILNNKIINIVGIRH